MFRVNKSASVASPTGAPDMAAINRLSRKELTAEEVYTFPVRLCDDIVDRDNEKFHPDTLKELATLFLGKPFLFDHIWAASKQTARIYATRVETEGSVTCLISDVYMLRLSGNEDLIAMIDGGILKEVSVGCAVGKATCSICGKAFWECDHRRGGVYEGKTCHVILSEAKDAYEASFVAVPAQPAAGVQKSAEMSNMSINDVEAAKARLAIEKLRFGG
ncbi:MAG: hypothetical protein J6K89_07965 [Oscillospiraceae bacterium]|nr:hypothetical protein [Oscillospiraceae bacterium]